MYDGTRHDFKSALANAKTAEPKAGLTAEQRYWPLCFPQAPTESALRKHSRRFGPEGVSEIADAYGMTATAAELAESGGKRQRRTTDSLRGQVIALADRGVIPAAIADTLNIADSRVRKLLAQAA